MFILIILATLLPLLTFAQTEIEGEVSGEWTAEGSPYIVVDSTWIPEDEELRIGPGVDVLFGEGLGLDVFGTLTAEGTEDDSVRFLPQEEDRVWRGINFNNPEIENTFTYCAIRSAQIIFGLGQHTILIVDNCDLFSQELLVWNQNGNRTSASRITVNNSVLNTNMQGVQVSGYRFTANNCEIIGGYDPNGNMTTAITNDCGGIITLENSRIYGSVLDSDNFTVTSYIDCEFERIYNYDILTISHSGLLRNCNISMSIVCSISEYFEITDCVINGDIRLRYFNGSITGCQIDSELIRFGDSEVYIENCDISIEKFEFRSGTNVEIYNCGITGQIESNGDRECNLTIERSFLQGELLLGGWVELKVINNTIILPGVPQQNHHTPFELYVQYGESAPVIMNNIIYMTECNEETSLFYFVSSDEDDPMPITDYNCFYGYDNLLHERNREANLNFELNETNIVDDPLFTSYDPLDPHLEWNSPCIDAGNPDSPLDPDSTRADIGARTYDPMHYVFRPSAEVRFPELLSINAFPNPFNSMTNISFNLREDSRIRLTIHDIQGREIAVLQDGSEVAGTHSVSWDATGMTSGVYFCRLQSKGKTATVKLAMVR
ncbi:T9SS type A sorting domain-containing protein [bacterium]|nr:T9SS type A sorting domain-containing protein [bacterium]